MSSPGGRNVDLTTLVARIPYAGLIGLQCLSVGDQYIFKLPATEDNVGNPTLPAIHGGVIGGFMETAAILHLMSVAENDAVPKIIDFSLDYLRPGRLRDSFCQCRVIRQGRKIANVSIECWQTAQSEPIAMARAHFLLPGSTPEKA
mgnify:CR=1 FL=1